MSHMYDHFSLYVTMFLLCDVGFSLCGVLSLLGFCIDFSNVYNFFHKFFGFGIYYSVYCCVALGFYMP